MERLALEAAMLLGKYRMLDLSRLYPGPLASHVLADMGMDVVKIEEPRPRYGMGRDILTPPDPTPEEEVVWSAYNSIARNKRSVALDLLDEAARPKAREVFFRLVERADAVLEGYRPGVVEWLGVDYEAVRARNPKVVYCSISAFGQSGPYAGFPGHDRQMSAVAGSVGPRHPETGRAARPRGRLRRRDGRSPRGGRHPGGAVGTRRDRRGPVPRCLDDGQRDVVEPRGLRAPSPPSGAPAEVRAHLAVHAHLPRVPRRAGG